MSDMVLLYPTMDPPADFWTVTGPRLEHGNYHMAKKRLEYRWAVKTKTKKRSKDC